MTFLDPILLWGLPLALLPVIIHLLNRLRHRSVKWAAMMFLLSASRKSTRYDKIKQWLILACRALAVLTLIVAIARPLAGGWIGWALHPAPDVIVMVLDRSASMEARMAHSPMSKREEALRLFSEAAKGYKETSRLVLFDTALRAPQEIGDAASLPQLSLAAATDTAADLPATLQAVLDWLQRTKPGSLEIWIASDLQRSNWEPESTRWAAVTAQLSSLPQNIHVRLLALDNPPGSDSTAISVVEVNRRHRAEPPEVEVVLNIERNNPAPVTLPISITIDGNRSQMELPVQGQSYRYRHRIALEHANASGWGKIELPADDNPRDNVAYFVYGPPAALRSAVVANDDFSSRILSLAASPFAGDTNCVSEIIPPAKVASVNWNQYALVLWSAPPPTEQVAANLRAFVEAGGNLICFASGEPGRFGNAEWGPPQTSEPDKPWKILRWEEQDGILGKTEEGMSLPLNELAVWRRQPLTGEHGVLAAFSDGAPMLARRTLGKGEMVFCATSPGLQWSNLREGVVLVPWIQRALQNGGRRFTQGALLSCGDTAPIGASETWTSVDGSRNLKLQAGVYRSATRLIAVNRPAAENEDETVDPAKARDLFGRTKVQLFTDAKANLSSLQSELWRSFLFAMAVFLLIEAILILPAKDEKVKLTEQAAQPEKQEVAA